jgi:hypothetical protein
MRSSFARLSYLVRRVIDRANFSFASYIAETGGESEAHQWIGPILRRFRELELELFANRLAIFFNSGKETIDQTSRQTDARSLRGLRPVFLCRPSA